MIVRSIATTAALLTSAVVAKDADVGKQRLRGGNDDRRPQSDRDLQLFGGGGFGNGEGFGGGDGFGGGGLFPDINIPDIDVPDFGDLTDAINNIVDSIPSPGDLELPDIPLPDLDLDGLLPTRPEGSGPTAVEILELKDKDPIDCVTLNVRDAAIASTLMVAADGRDCLLYRFSSLGPTQSYRSYTLQGEYRPIYLWMEGEFSQLINTIEGGVGNFTNPVNPAEELESIVAESQLGEEEITELAVFKGFSCDNGRCSVRNRGVPFDDLVETGPVVYERRCGLGSDFYPCLKIDFTSTNENNPRVVYARLYDGDKLLTVVKSDGYGYGYANDANDYKAGVQDVKVFNQTSAVYDPPMDFSLPNITVPNPVDLIPDIGPNDCAGAALRNATALANIFNKENGLECMVAFFSGLGPNQSVSSLRNVLQGRYTGRYHWHSGTAAQMTSAQVQWGGLQCDGGSCAWLGGLGNPTPASEASPAPATTETVCPIGADPFPCLRLDFMNGADPENPRVYYVREIDSVTFVSLSFGWERADWRDATDVTVLSQGE